MRLVVISPEDDDPREIAVLGSLMDRGLERYHVRKPHWTPLKLASWLDPLPDEWRSRVVLHQHHDLVARFALGGRHWRDEPAAPGTAETSLRRSPSGWSRDRDSTSSSRIASPESGDPAPRRGGLTSRSCHEIATLRAALGRFDSVFFGPLFPSLSKPGYGPDSGDRARQPAFGNRPRPDGSTGDGDAPSAEGRFNGLADLLAHRTELERSTAVFALGGVTAGKLARVRALGFDGAAVLGAVWQAADPVAAFLALQAESAARHGATPLP
jgi:thiamine-phosphate pyrophosphorylase